MSHKDTYKQMSGFMLQESIFTFLSLADVACSTALGQDSLIGINFAGSILAILYSLRIPFSNAIRVIHSRYHGSGDNNAIKSALTSTTILTGGIAFLSVLYIVFFGRLTLQLSALNDAQLEAAYDYLLYRIPGICGHTIGVNIARSADAQGCVGKVSKLRLCNLINIPLNLILMQPMGAAGISLATSLTEDIELILLAIVFKPKYGRPTAKLMKEAFTYGIVYVPQRVLSRVTSLFINNWLIAFLPKGQIATLQVVDKFNNGFYGIYNVSTLWCATFAGHAYGSGGKPALCERLGEFYHCFSRLIVTYVPIVCGLGFAYLGYIAPVEDLGLAMALLAIRSAITLPTITQTMFSNSLQVIGVFKGIATWSAIGFLIIRPMTVWASLQLGLGIFALPVYVFFGDLPKYIYTFVCWKRSKLTIGLEAPTHEETS